MEKQINMFETTSLWLEIALVTILFLLGHIFLGHFEERTSKWRKLFKYILTLVIILSLSVMVSRTFALGTLAVLLLPVIYIHAIMLPKQGINGWTGEPKSKYYNLRGWDKDIFKEKNKTDD